MNKPVEEWIVITQQIVGSGFSIRTLYETDRRRFEDKAAAVSHGFSLGRMDDFNLGKLENGKLVSFWWMDELLDHPISIILEDIVL